MMTWFAVECEEPIDVNGRPSAAYQWHFQNTVILELYTGGDSDILIPSIVY